MFVAAHFGRRVLSIFTHQPANARVAEIKMIQARMATWAPIEIPMKADRPDAEMIHQLDDVVRAGNYFGRNLGVLRR
jgi:acetolactate synthase regulatory subunit